VARPQRRGSRGSARQTERRRQGEDLRPRRRVRGRVHRALTPRDGRDGPKTLLLPERPGNRLAFGFRNILRNPHVALLFVVPNTTETLRIGGTAEITRDPALLDSLAARGKPALLATRITVEECFFHCGKAFIRSDVWKPESWPRDYRVNLGRQIAKKLGAGQEVADGVEAGLVESYTNRLY
jgi:hypothetical protein